MLNYDSCIKWKLVEMIFPTKDFKGQNVVVYFYPNTAGCTTEALEFMDL